MAGSVPTIGRVDDDRLAGLKGDELIIEEARLRFQRAKEWQGRADQWWLEDVKFANADDRNHWQWPDGIYDERDDGDKPCFTINKTRVHNDMIINEALQNKSSIKIRPTGGQASYEGSQAMQSMIRRIEYISKADSVYEKAIRDQVDGGIGYVLLDTGYVNDRTFDQDIYLRRCKDPRCVYLDPDIKEADGSDANFGFEFDGMSRDKFNRKYPKFKNKVGSATLGADEIWITADHVQVATYYRRSGVKDTLVSYYSQGELVQKLASEIKEESGKEIFDALIAQIENGEIDGRTREVERQAVEWFLIGGDVIMDRGPWAGRYIPIVRCVGVETVINGEYDRKGHTRALLSAQQMLNYNASASVEFGALQNKVPYIGEAAAFSGQEGWKDANRKNYAFLQYNGFDGEAPNGGRPIAKPERQEPPQTSPVYMQGMVDAERQMMMVSGQYQAQLGEQDNQSAASGKAINERQRQGDTATYHFVEHQGDMIRFIGVQLLDLIPKIYDTQRTLHVLGDDGTKRWIQIAPDQQDAVIELKEERDEAAILSFNPSVGEYDCMSDIGPNYATQRQEGWNALVTILQQNKELTGVIGDLLFKFGDFPGADEIHERLKKEIQATKGYLFNEKADPALVSAQAENQRLQGIASELMQKLAMKDLALKGKEERRDIEAANAETNRLKVLVEAMAKIVLTPADRERMEHELVANSHDASLQMLVAANAADLQPQGQANGADQ